METLQRFKQLHRTTAYIITAFVVLHLSNHLSGLFGVEVYQSVMETLRLLYRNIVGEVILLVSVLIQVISGVFLFWKTRKHRKQIWQKLQAYSGLYLAFFLLAHSSAVLGYRYAFGIPTDFYLGAFGFYFLPLIFIPYYFLGVFSVFTHTACLVRLQRIRSNQKAQGTLWAKGLMVFGAAVAVTITLIFMQAFYTYEMPQVFHELL